MDQVDEVLDSWPAVGVKRNRVARFDAGVVNSDPIVLEEHSVMLGRRDDGVE